jgi:hypothetical protein
MNEGASGGRSAHLGENDLNVDECAGDLSDRVVFADVIDRLIDLLNDQNMCAALFCIGFFEQANVEAVN